VPVNPQQYGPRQGPGGFSRYGPRVLKAKPAVISTFDLPHGFGSYDPVDAVVLGAAPLGQLDPDQGKALRLWVASGGLLIMTGGTDFSGLRAAGLDELAPVDVLGTETAPAIPELTTLYGAFDGGAPLLITRAEPRPGSSVLVGAAERPIVVERSFGKGQVRYVGVDPRHNPFRGWNGIANLWQDLLLPGAQFRQRRFSLANVGSQVSNTLYEMAQVKPPSAGHLLLFLFAYLIVVGPINYFGLRWASKLDLAWVTIPIVVIVFTGFSIVAAQTSRGGDLVGSSISTVEVYQQDGLVRTTGDLLLVPPSKNVHEVTFDRGAFVNDATLLPGGEPITTSYHPDNTLVAIPAEKWAPISFKVREVTESNRPLVSIGLPASLSPGGSVKVKNLTNFSITRAVLITGAGVTGLVDLGSGEEQQSQLTTPSPLTFTGWYSSQLTPGSNEAQVLSYLSPSFPYGGGSVMTSTDLFGNTPMPDLIARINRPVLVGFAEQDEPRFGYKGAVKRIGRQLLIIHL